MDVMFSLARTLRRQAFAFAAKSSIVLVALFETGGFACPWTAETIAPCQKFPAFEERQIGCRKGDGYNLDREKDTSPSLPTGHELLRKRVGRHSYRMGLLFQSLSLSCAYFVTRGRRSRSRTDSIPR